jgi:hypothetical protein
MWVFSFRALFLEQQMGVLCWALGPSGHTGRQQVELWSPDQWPPQAILSVTALLSNLLLYRDLAHIYPPCEMALNFPVSLTS